MSHWYYSDDQRNRIGPVGTDTLVELHHAGQLTPATLVWREGMPQWRPWREVANDVVDNADEPAPAFAAAPAQSHTDGVNPYAPAEATRSPYAPPSAALATQATWSDDGAEVVDAGFRKRAAAYLIDGMIIGTIGYIVQIVLVLVMAGAGATMDPANLASSGGMIVILLLVYLVPIALQAAYYAWFHASSHQATPGKMAIGIKVTGSDGQAISVGRGIGRYFGFLLSGFTFGIGFLMAAFTDRKRALHDMICETLVVDQWAYTAYPERQRHELGTVTVVVLVLGGGLIALSILVVVAVMIAASSQGL